MTTGPAPQAPPTRLQAAPTPGTALTTGKGWQSKSSSCRRVFALTSPGNCTIPQNLQGTGTLWGAGPRPKRPRDSASRPPAWSPVCFQENWPVRGPAGRAHMPPRAARYAPPPHSRCAARGPFPCDCSC